MRFIAEERDRQFLQKTSHDLKTPVSIHIRNDGELFTIDNPELLFDSYKKDMEGKFGLGLAIVKRVIESHGGYVEAENEQDGVLFKITFIKN